VPINRGLSVRDHAKRMLDTDLDLPVYIRLPDGTYHPILTYAEMGEETLPNGERGYVLWVMDKGTRRTISCK